MPSAAGAPLRVGTFNLASGRLPDGRQGSVEQLGTAVAALDVDVLAVQEVDRLQDRSAGVDQVAVVAEALGAGAARFVPTLAGRPGPGRAWQTVRGPVVPVGPSYGIGLVSRWPVLAWRVRRFPASRAVLPMPLPLPPPRRGRSPRLLLVPDEPRAAVAAVVATPAGPITVVCTHLSFAPYAAVRQLRQLVRWSRSLPGPQLLAGDLNLPGRVPSWLTGWTPLISAPTYPAPAPRVQLDHLLLHDRPGRPGHSDATVEGRVSVGMPLVELSDHRPLVVHLDR